MPLISARIVNLIKPDTAVGFAEAGEDQSVFCASVIQLQGQILGDDPALHTFEWEQTFGTPVTLVNPNTLFPTFINPQTSDIEFTLYVDRGTPFETSDTVFISRRPSSFHRTMIAGSNFAPPSKMPTGAFSVNTANSTFSNTQAIDVDFAVGAYSYNYPPDSTYSPIYKAEDLRRIKDNLGGKYWLMRDVDMSELNYPWDPLGTPQRPFSGELQGNGFSIQNLSITSTPVAVDGGDGFYDSVTMNNGFEGTNGQTTYTGTFGDTWTFDGNAQISNGQAFTGSTSAFFDGSGDRIYTANTPGLFGSGDWTVEFMCYPLTDTSNQYITNVYSGVNNRSWSISMGTNNAPRADVWSSSAGLIALTGPTNTLNENVWTHVVLMRKGTGIYIFTNGVLRDSDVGTIGASDTVYENGVTPTTDLYIGRRPGNITHFNGYIDNYRITHEARYPTTGFAPPTEFPDTIYKPAGLFSYIGNDAVIEEIGLTNANINGVSSSFYKGILAGSAQGYGTDDGGTVTVRNVYVEGTVDSGGDRAGGLIGHTGTNVGTAFENTVADVTVTGGGTNTGGWAGNFQTEGTYVDNYWNSDKTTAGTGSGGDTPIAGEVDERTAEQLAKRHTYADTYDFVNTWSMPPASFTDFTDPSGWSLIQEWNSADGDMASLSALLGTTVNMSGFAWSPDGTKLTISNTSEDWIRTFEMSVPFDPDSTATQLASVGETNPGYLAWNRDGSSLYALTIVGDTIEQLPANDFVISSGTATTSIDKSEVGINGTTDGGYAFIDDGSGLYWHGDRTGDNAESLVWVPLTNGDLDNPGTETLVLQSGVSLYGSVASRDGKAWYRQQGGLVERLTVPTTGDVANVSIGTGVNINSQVGITKTAWSTICIWIDPGDARYAWFQGETGTNEVQFAVFDTGSDVSQGPAQLQNNIFDRVANAGTALETTGRQGVIWDTPTTTIGGENEFRGREYIGAVVQDQNPSTGGWENARFIPPEQTEALITQGRRHRVFAVIDMTPKSRATKELRRVPREASFLVQKTVMPRGTTQGNASFIGGSTKFTAPLGSADLGVQSLSITIVNPRKTTFLALDTVGIAGQGDHLPFTAFTVVRYEPTVFTQTDTVAVGYISEHSVWVSASSFTRVYGGSIG